MGGLRVADRHGGVVSGRRPRDAADYTGLTPGAHTFDVRALDAAGNTDTDPATRTWTVETSLPAVSFRAVAGAPDQLVQTRSAFRSSSDGTWSVAAFPGLDEGAYVVRASQVGASGTGYSAPRTFTVDTTAPTVTVTVPADGTSTNDATPTLAGQAGAAPGDSASVLVDLSRGGSAIGTLTTTRSGASWSIDVPSALADGTYTVTARQLDALENVGISPSRTFTIDTTAPETSLTAGPAESTTATDASFVFSSSEAASTFECRLDGGAWTGCSSPGSYTGLALGPHAFEVRAIDVTGNVDATPASRSWTIVAGSAPLSPPVSLALKLDRPKARSLLKRGKIVFYATCNRACKLTVTSKLAVAGGRKARLYQNKKLTANLAVGKRTMLKLTLSKKTKAAVLKALRRHRKVTVRLVGAATGASGTRASARLAFSARR